MNAAILLGIRILIVITLYGFIGAAIWLLWKSIAGHGKAENEEAIPALSLSSSLLGEQANKSFTSSEVIVGRGPECDFILPHELVSARHGRFSYHHNQWWYEDLKSTNGSYLEDLRIEEPIVVKDGDVLFCSEVDVYIKIKEKS